FLFEPGGHLLVASLAPRPRLAEPEEQPIDARRVLAALAGAAQSDRHLDRQAGGHRGLDGAGTRPRLPRRDAASRYQAGSLRILAAVGAEGRRFRDGVGWIRLLT